MILRRIKFHVENENWFAVALDFFIVVVGVYIGVLLGNWNETRQERALYQQSYDRMIVEQQSNLTWTVWLRDHLREPIKTVQLALEDLRSCRTDDTVAARLDASFPYLGLRYQITLKTTALDQLVDNENFLRFQTPDLRNRLLNLSADLKRNREDSLNVSEGTDEDLINANTDVLQLSPLVYSGPDEVIDIVLNGGARSPELLRRTELKIPLAEACQNEAFLQTYYVWEGNAYYQSLLSAEIAIRLREDLTALGVPTGQDAGDREQASTAL